MGFGELISKLNTGELVRRFRLLCYENISSAETPQRNEVKKETSAVAKFCRFCPLFRIDKNITAITLTFHKKKCN